jgi:hypothetical protein
VQPLTALGIHKVEDLLTTDYKQVISRQTMRLRHGRLATSAHMQALYRVAYILHTAETPNIPHVKRKHFTDAAVSHNNYRTVHPVHSEAMIRASQRTTDHIFSNIMKPMPRKNHIQDITKYMTQRRTWTETAGDEEADVAQPTKRRPGTRTKSGAKKSEQRPSLMHTKRRRTTRVKLTSTGWK